MMQVDYIIADNAEVPCVKLVINGINALELPLQYSEDVEYLCNLLIVESQYDR